MKLSRPNHESVVESALDAKVDSSDSIEQVALNYPKLAATLRWTIRPLTEAALSRVCRRGLYPVRDFSTTS